MQNIELYIYLFLNISCIIKYTPKTEHHLNPITTDSILKFYFLASILICPSKVLSMRISRLCCNKVSAESFKGKIALT